MIAADDQPEFPIDPFPFAGPRWEPATQEEEEAFLAAVEEGIADTDAGRVIPGEEVTAWMRSFGTSSTLPRPRCK